MKKVTFLLSFCLLLLVSCAPDLEQRTKQYETSNVPVKIGNAAPTLEGSLSECMSPIVNFGYQTGDIPSDFDWSVVNNKVLPPQEWLEIAKILDASQLDLVQSRDNETLLWIDLSTSGLVRYQIRGTKWDEGTLLPGPVDYSGGLFLFLDRQNSVFGGRLGRFDQKDSRALLNHYNEQSNQWEPMNMDLANQDKLGIWYAEVDERGKFWLSVRDGAENQLYSLDPNTKKTKRHLTEYILLSDSFRISNNSIFILAESSDPNPRYLLLQYPLIGEEVKVKYIGAPIYIDYQRIYSNTLPDSIFIDKQQRVWVGARGWLDLPTDEWNFVISDPVFITVLAGAGQWKWGEPEITAETPDGRLWFTALRGTGWADLKLGKWCVFTSYQSNVLPDRYGNLWLIADDGLYVHKK